MMRLLFVCSSVLWLAACQTPQDLQQLRDQTAALEQKLATANREVATLKAEQSRLQADNAELNRVVAVLEGEKTSRVRESTSLRGQVRGFVQNQIDELRGFVLNSNLVDYIGSEQIQRSGLDEESRLVVDFAHPVPAGGTLSGVGARFEQSGQLTVKVLRLVEGKLVVIWESLPLAVERAGLQRVNFSVSVGVKQGDLLAYYLSPGLVSFDTGTGDTAYYREDINFGDSIKASALKGRDDRRAYSIGVFGLLNTP